MKESVTQTPKSWTFIRSVSYPKGALLPWDKVIISPSDRGFMFADGVYEVIRSYSGRLFLLDRHMARLRRSLKEVRICDRDLPLIEEMVTKVLARNRLTSCDATVYVQVTRGASWPRFHGFPDSSVLPTIYIEALPLQSKPSQARNGVKAILVKDIRWGRCDIKSIGLLLNVLARQQAIEAGAYEAIFIRNGVITEGTHTNICGVKSGVLLTHPRTNRVLPGITLEIVLDLCRSLGIPVREKPIRERELHALDELFLVGTTMEVTSVVVLDGRRVGSGRPGPIARRLRAAFRGHVGKSY